MGRAESALLLLALAAAGCRAGRGGASPASSAESAESAESARQRASAPAGEAPVAPQGAHIEALHRDGQTFLTFTELPAARGERYAVYRAAAPLTAESVAAGAAGAPLIVLPKGSGQALTDRVPGPDGRRSPRFLERWPIEAGKPPIAADTGLYVLTLNAADLAGAQSGVAHYAVAVLGPGAEAAPPPVAAVLGVTGPVRETVAPPRALRALTGPDGRGHLYVQFMDARRWNGTFHTPRPGNHFLDLPPGAPGRESPPAYAYTYLLSEPDPKSCGGTLPERLPVLLSLHGWGAGAFREPPSATPYYCALQLTPTDFGETWHFGFARAHDYRREGPIEDGDVIENFTEQRLLRMISDLLHDPVLGPHVDPQRIYVYGHSMGGGGALALALRYPQIFAAAYASQPVTSPGRSGKWLEDMAPKYGLPEQRLGVVFDGPDGYALPLKPAEGTPVYAWQDHGAQLEPGSARARLGFDPAPFGVSHSLADPVLPWATQGAPLYAPLDAAGLAYGAALTDTDHRWAAFQGLLPPLGQDRSLAPFQAFKVLRDETVPGLSQNTANPPVPAPDAQPVAPFHTLTYNLGVDWSASWAPWGGPPVDEPKRWCMALRAAPGAEPGRVSVTPRRTQRFHPAPGARLTATLTPLSGGAARPLGPTAGLTADATGHVLVPDVELTAAGARLCLSGP